MEKVTQEIVTVWWEGDEPKVIDVANGSHHFFHLRKMTRDDVAELHGAVKKEAVAPKKLTVNTLDV